MITSQKLDVRIKTKIKCQLKSLLKAIRINQTNWVLRLVESISKRRKKEVLIQKFNLLCRTSNINNPFNNIAKRPTAKNLRFLLVFYPRKMTNMSRKLAN